MEVCRAVQDELKFETKHLYCVKCGYAFMFSQNEQIYFDKKRLFPRTICHSCSSIRRMQKIINSK